jgi:8-oxo-dGTP pyrophosphatase MutT (NUDIX family)
LLVQYGTIAWRRQEDGEVRVLLITSRETRRWVVPRGNAIFGRGPAGSAAQEAFEEAGIRGAISKQPVGSYRYDKRRKNGQMVPAEVRLYALRVLEELDDWPERHQRERRWFAPAEAADAVDEPDLKELLRGFRG